MVDRCRNANLSEPEIRIDGGSWVTTVWRRSGGKPKQATRPWPESRPESRLESLLAARDFSRLAKRDLGKAEISRQLGHKTVSGELHKQIKRLVEAELIEMTIPGKPTSRLQKYRLTPKGQALLASPQPGGKT